MLAPRIVDRVGTTSVVRAGLALLAAAFVWIAIGIGIDAAYLEIVGQMILLGVGLGLTTAPATESIMGSLSADKAGIGSAVNDTTRELGGTLGVAIIGSVFSSVYIGALETGRRRVRPAAARGAGDDDRTRSASARIVAEQLGPRAPALPRPGRRRLPVGAQRRLPRRGRRRRRRGRVRQPLPPARATTTP